MTDFPPPPPLPILARYAIIVDVGYIYAAAGELLFSTSARREFRVDADKLISALTRHADSLVPGGVVPVHPEQFAPYQAVRVPGQGRTAPGVLVRRRPGPGAHDRPAGDRPDGLGEAPAGQPERTGPAEGGGRADPGGHGSPGPASRHDRRGAHRRRRGHGAGRGGRP